ncbi:hypothetical protein WAI453_006318 [Rhynchosporium graminicola]
MERSVDLADAVSFATGVCKYREGCAELEFSVSAFDVATWCPLPVLYLIVTRFTSSSFAGLEFRGGQPRQSNPMYFLP